MLSVTAKGCRVGHVLTALNKSKSFKPFEEQLLAFYRAAKEEEGTRLGHQIN